RHGRAAGAGAGLSRWRVGLGALLLRISGYSREQAVQRFLQEAVGDVSQLSLGDGIYRAARAEEGGREGEDRRYRQGDRSARRPRAVPPRRALRDPQRGPPGGLRG